MIILKIISSIALATLSVLFAVENAADKWTNNLSRVFSFCLILSIFLVWS